MTLLLTFLVITFAANSVFGQCESYWDDTLNGANLTAIVESDFTICYDPEVEEDVRLPRWWLIKALEVGRIKYGTGRLTYDGKPLHTTLLLAPYPTNYARPGYTRYACCDIRNDYVHGEIHYLSPSLWPDWRTAGPCWRNMMDYHAHYIFHEMMHAIQTSVRSNTPGAPKYSWIWEALAEYDAYHYSSTWNRTHAVEYLLELADQSHRDRIYFAQDLNGDSGLRAESVYFGGAVIMEFYAYQFGEDIHSELLRKEPRDVFSGSRAIDGPMFDRFKSWFNNHPGIQTHERCLWLH